MIQDARIEKLFLEEEVVVSLALDSLTGNIRNMSGPDLMLVMVLPQVLLQSLWNGQLADVPVGLQLVADGPSGQRLQKKTMFG